MNFNKEKVSALSGHTEVRYTHTPKPDEEKMFPPFRVIANKFGVRMEGASPAITDMEELEEFAKLISLAWVEHTKLKPQIEVTATLPT